jgi:hypothetical protein
MEISHRRSVGTPKEYSKFCFPMREDTFALEANL